ncbi:DUF3471 domain-containing protein [Salinimicrobium xinjiangense]|uniref:DUF3471 domain-containing protein n=1 Tax=Salinimicrobium xinjiangense TaxID=438596 RepID=UPI00048F342C|nr:DUF3471 domain-containing protein [Salinimicrobium xinjiangense]
MKMLVVLFYLFICASTLGELQLQKSSDVKKKINELGERYTELGRFSGSILVAADGEIIYSNFFGKADYESRKLFSESTVFSLGPFSELILNHTCEQLQSEVNSDSMKSESQKAVVALITKLHLKNTFLQTEAPGNAATGYVHNIGPQGIDTTPVSQDTELQLWTNAADLQKLITTITDKSLVQDGYSENGGFSYAIRKTGNLNVIVLSNRRHPVADEMTKGIKSILEDKNYMLPLPRKEIQIAPALLKEYAGNYALNPKMQLQVITNNDSLFVLMGPQKVHLKPQSDNQFFMEQGDSAIRFLKDSEGNISSAELLDGFLTGNRISRVE